MRSFANEPTGLPHAAYNRSIGNRAAPIHSERPTHPGFPLRCTRPDLAKMPKNECEKELE